MALPDDQKNATHQFSATLVDLVIELVDRSLKRTGDPLLDLAEAKTTLANRVPMSEIDIGKWQLADALQQDIVRKMAPRGEDPVLKQLRDNVVEIPKAPAQRYGKSFTIQTGRGKKIVLIDDVQINVSADGFIRARTDFGPIVEKILPTHQAAAISIGEIPESEEEQ